MAKAIAPPWNRQLETYRHQALAAPTMLDESTLSPAHVAEVLTQQDYLFFYRRRKVARLSISSVSHQSLMLQ